MFFILTVTVQLVFCLLITVLLWVIQKHHFEKNSHSFENSLAKSVLQRVQTVLCKYDVFINDALLFGWKVV